MKKLVVIWLAVAAALVIVRAAHAAPKIRVSFSVTCEDSSSTSKLTGHISNALRSISDVEVVEMDPLFDISLIAVPLRDGRGEIFSYTLAVVVSSDLLPRVGTDVRETGCSGKAQA